MNIHEIIWGVLFFGDIVLCIGGMVWLILWYFFKIGR